MPGMAAAETADCEPEAFHNAMFLQGFFGIVGAAGIKAASIANQRTKGPLIEPNQSEKEMFHMR